MHPLLHSTILAIALLSGYSALTAMQTAAKQFINLLEEV